jgi:hypothetical protein
MLWSDHIANLERVVHAFLVCLGHQGGPGMFQKDVCGSETVLSFCGQEFGKRVHGITQGVVCEEEFMRVVTPGQVER